LASVLGADFPSTYLQGIDCSLCASSTLASAVFRQTYDAQEDIVAFEAELNACSTMRPALMGGADCAAAVMITAAPPREQRAALEWLAKENYTGIVAIDTAIAYVGEFARLLTEYGGLLAIVLLNEQEYGHVRHCLPATATSVVKRGAKGAYIVGSDSGHCSAPAVGRVHTTTGAGDVLAGAMLAFLLAGMDLPVALNLAVERASLYVQYGPAVLEADGQTHSGRPE
jgi:sugar/nucleoside kinase (ribokinase family)